MKEYAGYAKDSFRLFLPVKSLVLVKRDGYKNLPRTCAKCAAAKIVSRCWGAEIKEKIMASFDKRINNCARLDWQILMNGSVSLYYDKAILEEDMQWLKSSGYQLYIFDFHMIKTRAEFHKKVKEELKLPDYYGENISAFSDCLMFDLPTPVDGGVAIVLKGFDEYCRIDGDYAHEILERLDENSRRQMLFGDRFLTLVQIDDKNVLIKAVGKHSIILNLSKRQALSAPAREKYENKL